MSVEAWIIEEREKEERRRREEEERTGIRLPRTPHEMDPGPPDEPRQGRRPETGRVEILDISPRPDNVVDL